MINDLPIPPLPPPTDQTCRRGRADEAGTTDIWRWIRYEFGGIVRLIARTDKAFIAAVNGLAFGLAAWLVPGFDVDSIGWAILGSIVVSLVSWFMGWFGRASQPPPSR